VFIVCRRVAKVQATQAREKLKELEMAPEPEGVKKFAED